jgi:WD40 repeat protein
VTQPGRSFGKTRRDSAILRGWRSLRLIGPALVLLLVLTACYQPVDPTPTAPQLTAPPAPTSNPPPQTNPPNPQPDGQPNQPKTDGGEQNNPPPNGTPSPVATPATPAVGTPSSSAVGPPPRITVTPTGTRGPGPVGPSVPTSDFIPSTVKTPTSPVKPPPVATTKPTVKAPVSITPPVTKKVTVTVTATGQTGGIIITKRDPDKKPVAGSCFALLDNKEKQIASACDQGDGDVDPNPGTIQINGIPPGQYTLRETLVPVGYLAAPDEIVGIVGGKSFAKEVIDKVDTTTGAILINKVDAAGTPVEGACFDVLASATPVAVACDGGQGDADPKAGQIRIEVSPGSYTVAETPPAGYAPAAPATVTVTAGQFSSLEVMNQVVTVTPTASTPTQTGTLTIHVRDAGNQPLGGACFTVQLSASSNQVCDDDKDGELPLTNVPPGDYTLHESTPPDGYTGADDQTVTVEAGKAAEATFVNQPTPTPTPTTAPVGALQVQVLDEQGQPLTGACFSLTPRSGTAGEKQSRCDKDDGAEDGLVSFPDLPPGMWRLREYQPPKDFPVPDSVDIEIKAGETTQHQMTNIAKPTVGALQITKVDDQGQPLGGACFDLAGKPQSFHGCDNEQGDADNAAGVILLQGLPPGDYEVSESRTPDGYQTAPNQTVTVAAGGDPATLSFTDNPVAQTQPTAGGGQTGGQGQTATTTGGVTLSLPVVYQDDLGHLWLLQPGESGPTRLDSDDLPFNTAVKPIFSADHSWLAFFVTNNTPNANLTLYNVSEHQLVGQIPFGEIGTPVQIAWLPGSNDTLAVAVQASSSATTNVYTYQMNQEVLGSALFSVGAEPATVDKLIPAPAGSLLAIQTTGSDGDTDVFVDDTSTQPNPVNVGPNNGDNPDQFAGWSPDGSHLLVRSSNPETLFATDAAANATPLGTTSVFPGDPANGTDPRWSADGSRVAFFDADPQSGGQLQMMGLDGSSCPAVQGVIAFDWSPTDPVLDVLISGADQLIHLVGIGLDCSQQPITDFDQPVDNLRWSPNGQVLAVVNRTDTGAAAWLVANGQVQQIDPNTIAFSDLLAWSPASDALVLFAGGPPATMWVVQPGSPTPVTVSGSTLPEGTKYIMAVWWP